MDSVHTEYDDADQTHHGVPLYDETVPEGLLTRGALRAQGRRPIDPDQPAAYVRQPSPLFHRDRTESIPGAPDRDQRRCDRDAAARWANEIRCDPRAVVADTETTDKTDGHVVALSAVRADGSVLIDTLINPEGVPISRGATDVHGLADADVASAPTLAELADALAVLHDATIVAWNGDFDRAALRRSYDHVGVTVPGWVENDWHDAMLWHAQHVGEWDDQRGHYRFHRAGGNHSSADDCRAVWDRIHQIAGHAPCTRTLQLIEAQIRAAADAGAYNTLHGPDAARTILAALEQVRAASSLRQPQH